MNLYQAIPLALIAATCLISVWAWNNALIFQRYLFNVGAVRQGQYRRLITSGFLHGSWMHLLFNMLTLYFFRVPILVMFGWLGFLLLYFAALLAGNLFSLWLYRNRPSYTAIGASGAVSGIVFASVAAYPHMALNLFFIPIDIPGWLFALLYFAYSVYMVLNPSRHDNIGHAAHLGGAAAGMAFTALFAWQQMLHNALHVGIMLLPLLYLAYELLLNKKRF